jgi:hypothetical protein
MILLVFAALNSWTWVEHYLLNQSFIILSELNPGRPRRV